MVSHLLLLMCFLSFQNFKILFIFACLLFAVVVIVALDDPRYVEANAGCKHFDAYGGPENIPVSRLSFSANVRTHMHVVTCGKQRAWSLGSAGGGVNSHLNEKKVLI